MKFIPTRKDLKTSGLVRMFIKQLYRLNGFPTEIVTDRGRKVDSLFWREVFKKLDITLSMDTAKHP